MAYRPKCGTDAGSVTHCSQCGTFVQAQQQYAQTTPPPQYAPYPQTPPLGEKPNTAAFGVCRLLFAGIVPGILLLVTPKDQPRAQY